MRIYLNFVKICLLKLNQMNLSKLIVWICLPCLNILELTKIFSSICYHIPYSWYRTYLKVDKTIYYTEIFAVLTVLPNHWFLHSLYLALTRYQIVCSPQIWCVKYSKYKLWWDNVYDMKILSWNSKDCILLHVVSWEPEGRYHYSKMFSWEPEGRYHHRLCTVIAPFWFSAEHLWILIEPFWLSTDEIMFLCVPGVKHDYVLEMILARSWHPKHVNCLKWSISLCFTGYCVIVFSSIYCTSYVCCFMHTNIRKCFVLMFIILIRSIG